MADSIKRGVAGGVANVPLLLSLEVLLVVVGRGGLYPQTKVMVPASSVCDRNTVSSCVAIFSLSLSHTIFSRLTHIH